MKKNLLFTAFLLIGVQVTHAQFWQATLTSPNQYPYWVRTNGHATSGLPFTNQPLYFAMDSLKAGYNTDSTRLTSLGVGSLFTLSNTYPPILIGGTFSGNVALGDSTLFFDSLSKYNTATGSQAMYTNSVGLNNTPGGFQSMYSNIGAIHITAHGFLSLFSNYRGSSNTANGDSTLYTLITAN